MLANKIVFLPTICPDTHVSMKKNSKDFVMEKVGGGVGGGDNPPPCPPNPEREGVAANTHMYC